MSDNNTRAWFTIDELNAWAEKRLAAEAAAAPVQGPVAYKPPAKWTDAEIKDGYRGIRWVTADGVYGRPTEEDVARYLGYTTPPAAQPATAADTQIAAHAKRLALELECLLLSCEETAVVSKWWASAHQALCEYQDDIDRLYPQDHVSPLGKD